MDSDSIRNVIQNEVVGANTTALRRLAEKWWTRFHAEPTVLTDAITDLWFNSEEMEGDLTQFAACLLAGPASINDRRALELLLIECSASPDWRVQEILAKALTWRCELVGWEQSIPDLVFWLSHPVANVRRAAAEGPRVWTKRPYFNTHPQHAVELLGQLIADPSAYAKKSCVNALNDISKTEPDLVLRALRNWVLSAPPPADTRWLIAHIGRGLSKTHPAEIETLRSFIPPKPG